MIKVYRIGSARKRTLNTNYGRDRGLLIMAFLMAHIASTNTDQSEDERDTLPWIGRVGLGKAFETVCYELHNYC